VVRRASGQPADSWVAALVALGFAAATLVVPGWAGAIAAGQPGIDVVDLLATVIWVAIEAAVLTAALRWSDRRGHEVARSVVLAITLAAVCGALISTAYSWGASALIGVRGAGATVGIATAVGGAFEGCIILGTWTLGYVLPRAVREARERERERHELRRQVESARLRATLEPHFVLNTLNAIASLVGDDPERARELIGDLGELLRDVVRYAELAEHSVADELAWLCRYGRILETRHQDRLQLHFEAAPDIAAHRLPVLLLQPLVENAIQHGALQRPAGGQVWVRFERLAEKLRCTVADNGPGFAAGAPRAGATGLALVRRRLEIEMPGSTMMIEREGVGATVTVLLAGAAA
jgi:Histidine kinase